MTNYIILGLLSKKEMTVYDIKLAMDKSIGQFYSSSFGSINPAIKKLEKLELIDCKEQVENSRLKKTYSITEAGKEDYEKWLLSPIQQGRIKDEVLIRVFFLGDSDPEKRKGLISDYLKVLSESRKELEQTSEKISALNLSESDTESIKYQVSTLQFGMDYIAFKQKWFKNLLKQL